MTEFLWPLAKHHCSTLALPRPNIVFCLQPSEVGYNYYMSNVSCITKDTFASFSQQSSPELFFSLCISSLLKGAARNKTYTSVQLAHSEEHQQQVEVVLTYLLTDLFVEERRRIGKGSVYPWEWAGLSLHWSPPNWWVELCDAWFGGDGGILYSRSVTSAFLYSYSCCLFHSHKDFKDPGTHWFTPVVVQYPFLLHLLPIM